MGDLISGGLSLLGGILTNQSNSDIANSANVAAQQRQDQANAFSQQQYSTRYQTTVKDLEAAGLNPMLAYSQGVGSQPTGQAAPVNVPAPRVNALSNAVQAYNSAAMNAADIKLKDEQVNATNAQAEVSRTQALANIANTAKLDQDTNTGKAVEDVQRKQLESIAADINLKKAQTGTASAATAKTEAETYNVKNRLGQKPWWQGSTEEAVKQQVTNASEVGKLKNGKRILPTYSEDQLPNHMR